MPSSHYLDFVGDNDEEQQHPFYDFLIPELYVLHTQDIFEKHEDEHAEDRAAQGAGSAAPVLPCIKIPARTAMKLLIINATIWVFCTGRPAQNAPFGFSPTA